MGSVIFFAYKLQSFETPMIREKLLIVSIGPAYITRPRVIADNKLYLTDRG